MDNEFLLQDRLQKIRQIISQYGEENFYISFSGGKDSTVLSALVDMAIPKNKIPRVSFLLNESNAKSYGNLSMRNIEGLGIGSNLLEKMKIKK